MRITLLIESLGSGGAERQICTLAVEFQRRGHEVRVASYAEGDFYLPVLRKAGIEHVRLYGKSRLAWIWSVRRFLRSGRQDVVLAYLQGPCAYAELAALPWRNWGLVVSERVAVPDSHKKRWDLLKMLHRFSDYVVTNSHVNRLMLEAAAPDLKGRLLTIYNAVDLNHFSPRQGSRRAMPLRLVVASSYQVRKNMLGLIEAVRLLRENEPGFDLLVDWYGELAGERDEFEDALKAIREYRLEGVVRLNPATTDIVSEYRGCDVVLLASFFEGLPNTVCEAMACGRPVLMSAVCDAGNLVHDGVNGFLFDPGSPRSIAEAIKRFSLLTEDERETFGRNSRRMAEALFDVGQVTDQYLRILAAAAGGEKLIIDNASVAVPETARRMVCE